MKEAKEWIIQGFSEKTKDKIDNQLMNDEFSYWFRFRTISWYRIRRIKGLSPKKTIEKALNKIKIDVKVYRNQQLKFNSSIWIISPIEEDLFLTDSHFSL